MIVSLVPGIHDVAVSPRNVDGPDKPGHDDIVESRLALALHAEDHRQRKAQAFVRDQRRRRRHRVGALDHRDRGVIKGRIARALFNVVESTWPSRSSVKLTWISADFKRALGRIALVLVEMGHQRLLPGRAHAARGFAGALRRRNRARRFPEWHRSLASPSLRPRPTPSRPSLHRRDLGLVFFRLFRTRSRVTTRSASSVSVGVSLGRSVSLTSAFCSASCGEAIDASVSGPAAGRSPRDAGRPVRDRSRSRARRESRRRRQSANARPPAPRRRDAARARWRLRKSRAAGTAFVRRGQTSISAA